MEKKEQLGVNGKRIFDNYMALPDRAKELYMAFHDKCVELRNGSVVDSLDDELVWINEECESPIEKIMMLALVIHKKVYANKSIIYEIDPQIDIDNYRVDCRIRAMLLVGIRDCREIDKEIIVECDGHEFHEKTKEQVIKNNNRDYDLKTKGYEVLHFSGSEIFNTPMKCAEKVFEYIERYFDRMIEVKG